jgi:hypothetical protein
LLRAGSSKALSHRQIPKRNQHTRPKDRSGGSIYAAQIDLKLSNKNLDVRMLARLD